METLYTVTCVNQSPRVEYGKDVGPVERKDCASYRNAVAVHNLNRERSQTVFSCIHDATGELIQFWSRE